MKVPSFFYRHAGLGSLLATATNAVALFVIFRLGYRNLGPSAVGAWALIQGILFISRIADGGSGGNITRLVSIDRGKQGAVKLRNFIVTGLLVGTGPILVLGLLILAPAFYYLKSNYSHQIGLAPMVGLLLCSLTFGVFISAAQILSGCLDGLGLMALRGYLSCIPNALLVVVGYIFIHSLGIIGLGLAYVAYGAVLSLVLALGILLFNPAAGTEYRQQSVSDLMKKTVNFNAGFLLMTLSQLLMDPTCKILIGRFGALDSVALFDLANKICTQARVLYQAVLQSVLPLLSREGKEIEREMREKLVRWNAIVARWAVYTLSAVVLSSGYLSILALGGVRTEFVDDVLLLSLANAVNTVGLVGYYVEVGSGHLRRLVVLFILAALSNVALGLALGYLLGYIGVIIGMSLTLSWAGIALARSVLGNFRQVLGTLWRQAGTELMLFLLLSLACWLVLVGVKDITMLVRAAVVGTGSLVLLTTFLFREGNRLAAHFARLSKSFALASAKLRRR